MRHANTKPVWDGHKPGLEDLGRTRDLDPSALTLSFVPRGKVLPLRDRPPSGVVRMSAEDGIRMEPSGAGELPSGNLMFPAVRDPSGPLSTLDGSWVMLNVPSPLELQ